MATAGDGGSAWRRSRRLLVGLFVCRGLVLLCVMPPFEGWDEYEHVGYVVHVLENGEPPVLGRSNVPRSLLAEALKFPQPRCVVELQLGRLGAVDYSTFWARRTTPKLLPGDMELYQAQHSWWYYRLVAPLFRALGGVADLRRSVGGLRLLNLGFEAAAAWIVLRGLGRLVRHRADAALIGLAIASHPLFLMSGLRVANDALGIFLATIAVVLTLTLESKRLVLRCAGIGLAAGLAVLAKAVNFGLLPFVAFCGLAFVVRERIPPGRALAAGCATALTFLAVTQGELRGNLARYGALTPMQEAMVNRSRGRTAADLLGTASEIRWDKEVRRLWLRDTFSAGGWSDRGPLPAWTTAYSFAVLAGLLGYIATRVGPGRRAEPVYESAWTPISCAMLCLGFSAALGYHMVQSRLAWGRATTCPWYASPAIPWFVALAAGGGLSWPRGWLGAAMPVVLAAICLAGEALAIWGRMVPGYSGGASGLEALRRLASLQPPFLGTATLIAAVCGTLGFLALFAWSWARAEG